MSNFLSRFTDQQITYGAIIIGVVLALASLLIDAIGIGTEGFGVAQIIGLILGVILIGVGVYWGYFREAPPAGGTGE
jgi:hypothetical protein